ncbi:Lrp/AsnC ligand binding domain-containing protein [Candidatus Bathyarchaeota archaeon]|nr:Lrp/AsnC ligand binding domain-containing protein [Candidatus Bathyarchaeota archaeon]
MPSAYVMISTELGSEEQVVKALETLPQIKETYIVYGIYDVITRVEFADKQELNEIIIRKIRGTPGIRNTITLMVI